MVQIVIVLNDNGSLQVTGPIQDKILCYGILELAKDVIRVQEVTKPGIIAVRQPLADNGRGLPA